MSALRLRIAEPCHENWNGMTPYEHGRFCAACHKTVMDFTGKTDRQIAAFFRRPKGEVCGRFHVDQLDRDLLFGENRTPWLKYLFTLAVPVYFFTQKGLAQGKVNPLRKKETPVIQTPPEQPTRYTMGDTILAPQPEPVTRIIRGKVVDEKGAPLPFVSVVVKGTSQGTAAGSDGSFRLTMKNAGPVTLVFSSIGYQTTTVEGVSDSVNVVLPMPMEVVTMGYVITTKRKKPAKPKPVIRRHESALTRMDLFPNPLPSGSPLHVRLEGMEQGDYLLAVLGANGTLVLERRIQVTKSRKEWSEPLLLPGGTYFVRLVQQKSGKQWTEQLQVQ